MDDAAEEVHLIHEDLMGRVESLMKLLYAAKSSKEPERVAFVIGALEVYKIQSSLTYTMVMSGLLGTNQRDRIIEMRSTLQEALVAISELAKPLLAGRTA